MTCKTYDTGTLKQYKYVVTLSEYDGKILLSRHKNRTTWETQGGHIEAGETPLEAARRELYEESGATDFEIAPLCDYWGGRNRRLGKRNGVCSQNKSIVADSSRQRDGGSEAVSGAAAQFDLSRHYAGAFRLPRQTIIGQAVLNSPTLSHHQISPLPGAS